MKDGEQRKVRSINEFAHEIAAIPILLLDEATLPHGHVIAQGNIHESPFTITGIAEGHLIIELGVGTKLMLRLDVLVSALWRQFIAKEIMPGMDELTGGLDETDTDRICEVFHNNAVLQAEADGRDDGFVKWEDMSDEEQDKVKFAVRSVLMAAGEVSKEKKQEPEDNE